MDSRVKHGNDTFFSGLAVSGSLFFALFVCSAAAKKAAKMCRKCGLGVYGIKKSNPE